MKALKIGDKYLSVNGKFIQSTEYNAIAKINNKILKSNDKAVTIAEPQATLILQNKNRSTGANVKVNGTRYSFQNIDVGKSLSISVPFNTTITVSAIVSTDKNGGGGSEYGYIKLNGKNVSVISQPSSGFTSISGTYEFKVTADVTTISCSMVTEKVGDTDTSYTYLDTVEITY